MLSPPGYFHFFLLQIHAFQKTLVDITKNVENIIYISLTLYSSASVLQQSKSIVLLPSNGLLMIDN